MYYDASWRLVEERIDESYVSSPGLNRHMQNLWGARYIDDLISRRKDANRDGDYIDSTDGVFYAITDVQFSVVVMLTSTGKLHERVAYDSYGTARHHWKDDVDGDGDVDSSDKTAVTALLNKAIYQSGYNPAADIDRSGTIDSADVSLVSSKVIAALPAGEISDRAATGPDNTIGYDGYVFNPENLLYTVRFRHYDTVLGRWLERDPAGYVDGANLYEYVASNIFAFLDPYGLCCQPAVESVSPGIIQGILNGTFTVKDLVAMGMTVSAATALIAAIHEQEAMRDWAKRQMDKIEEALKKECPRGPDKWDWCRKLKRALASAERGIKSLQKTITTHEKKIADYLADPDKYDNLDMLKNTTDPVLRQKIIEQRVKHLRTEIRAAQQAISRFEALIEAIRKAMERLGC